MQRRVRAQSELLLPSRTVKPSAAYKHSAQIPEAPESSEENPVQADVPSPPVTGRISPMGFLCPPSPRMSPHIRSKNSSPPLLPLELHPLSLTRGHRQLRPTTSPETPKLLQKAKSPHWNALHGPAVANSLKPPSPPSLPRPPLSPSLMPPTSPRKNLPSSGLGTPRFAMQSLDQASPPRPFHRPRYLSTFIGGKVQEEKEPNSHAEKEPTQNSLTEENQRLKVENEGLRKRLHRQIRLTEEFKSKLSAVLRGAGSLSKQARFAAMQELGTAAEERKRVCSRLFNLMLAQLRWNDEFSISCTFKSWHELKVETQEVMSHKVSHLGSKGVITTLKEIRDQTAQAAFLLTFLRWRELVLVSHRRRERPFLEQNKESNLVNSLDLHRCLSHTSFAGHYALLAWHFQHSQCKHAV